MIHEALNSLGLSETEVKIYLTVLQQGKISISDVSKIAKINRTTVYSASKELLKKGIIQQDLGGKTQYLLAVPPKELFSVIEKKEKQLKKQRELLDQSMEELSSLTKNTHYSIPKITFIDEGKLKDYLYNNAEKWNKSIMQADETWWGFQDPTFVSTFQEWIDWYWKKTAPSNLVLKLLTHQSETEETMKEKGYTRRKIHFWEHGKKFTSSIWAVGDYVVFIFTNKKPFYLIEIHDAVIAHNMREFFNGIWSQNFKD